MWTILLGSVIVGILILSSSGIVYSDLFDCSCAGPGLCGPVMGINDSTDNSASYEELLRDSPALGNNSLLNNFGLPGIVAYKEASVDPFTGEIHAQQGVIGGINTTTCPPPNLLINTDSSSDVGSKITIHIVQGSLVKKGGILTIQGMDRDEMTGEINGLRGAANFFDGGNGILEYEEKKNTPESMFEFELRINQRLGFPDRCNCAGPGLCGPVMDINDC